MPCPPAVAARAALPYRPEVDGLRALAVLAVMLFHAELGPLEGGFVGVDVFFVISGFLITGILLREQEAGVFTLGHFYARRMRRILPALLAVVLACVPPAVLLMTTEELRHFCALLASAAVGASNLVLAATTGYFDGASELRPLLHTWSLAVEEQFYLVFPLLLLLAPRLGRRRAVGCLAAAAVLSLACAEWGWRHAAEANFFLAPGRIWELLAGSLCAFAADGPRPAAQAVPRRWRGRLAAIGLLAVLASMVLFRRQTPVPSLVLLLPVLGAAALVLYAGPENLAGRLLARPMLVCIGLISYSAYLWHHPLLAFGRLYLQGPLPWVWRWALVIAALALAALTWRWIELPLRRGGRGTRRTLAVGGTACAAVVALGAAGFVGAAVLIPPAPPQVQAAFARPARAATCFDIPYAQTRPDGWSCPINGAAGAPDFVLFGDSHALQVLEAFEEAARASGRAGVFAGFSGCAPLLDVVPLNRPNQAVTNCAGLNQRVLAFVRDHKIRDVYLVGKWSYYTSPWQGGSYLNALGRKPGEPISVENSRSAFSHGVEATARAYDALGVRLHVLEQVPQQEVEPRRAYDRLTRERWRGAALLRESSVQLAHHRQLQEFPAGVFRRKDLPPVRLMNVDALFCDRERCALGTPQEPYYSDLSHLSVYGARRMVPALTASLREGRVQSPPGTLLRSAAAGMR